MIRHLFLFFLLFNTAAFAQKVKILKVNSNYFKHSNVEGYQYLHPKMRKETYEWIANVRVNFDTIKPNTLQILYNKLYKKSNKLCANAFRILASNLYAPKKEKFIEIGIFYLNWENRNENKELFEANKIYMFGFLGHHRRIEGYKISVNDKKMILRELQYKLVQSKRGSVVKLTLGNGFKRDNLKVEIENKMMPKYFKFEIYKGPFKRGLISEHEWSFGEMLVQVLKKEVIKI